MTHHKHNLNNLSFIGLSTEQAAQRLEEDGPNDLGLSQRRALAAIIREILFEPMFLLLLAAGAVYLLIGDRNEALVLLGFVIVIMSMTVIQERRTDNALAALRDLSSPRALVIRDGLIQRIAGHEVVREDLLILSEGDRVAVHVPIAGLALLPVLTGLPLLLAPLHIAFLELVIDPACSVVFEAEKMSSELMKQAPRSISEALLTTEQVISSLMYGGITTAGVFFYYQWLLHQAQLTPGSASACAFVMLVTANAALIVATRSADIHWNSLFKNFTPISLWVLIMTFCALLLVTIYPPFIHAFKFSAVSLQAWMSSFACGFLLLLVFILVKRIKKRVW